MANIKFSQFTQKTTLGTVDFLVGYTGAQNIQIDPVDLLSGYSQGTGAAGQVTFFSAASTVTGDNDFYWNNTSKRLGIGISGPNRLLHVNSNGQTDIHLTTNSQGTSASDGMTVFLDASGSGGLWLRENADMRFATSGTERVLIKGGGNVGIGTNNPAAKLQVSGTFIASGISQLGSGGNNVYLTSSSAGNVGIGTSSPSQKLHIEGGKMLIKHATTEQYNYQYGSGQPVWSFGGGNYFNVKQGGTTGFVISSTLNVGIGTTSPQTKFHVSGGQALFASDTAVNPIIPFGIEVYRNAGGNSNVLIHQDDGNHESVLHMRCGGNDTKIKTGPNTWALKIDTEAITDAIALMATSGNLGIATTNAKFEGANNAYVDFTDPSSSVRLQNSGHSFFGTQTNTDLRFKTNGTVKMSIQNSGNVGIGTTSPSAKLQIESTSGNALSFTHSGQETYNISHGTSGLYLKLGSTLLTGWTQNHDFTIWDTSGNNYVMFDGSTQKVGIGTTSPTAKLHIQSSNSAATANLVYLENIGSGGSEGVSIKFNPMFNAESMIASNREGAVANACNLTFHTYNNTTNEAMRITSSGNVGIGTITPDTKFEVVNDVDNSSNTALDVNAGIIIHNGDSSGTAVLKLRGSGGDSGAVVFGAGGGAASDKFHVISRHNQTKRFTVQANGNVGIGTSSPASKLEVDGGDIEVDDSANGLILRSPDGTRYRITVANGGTLSVSAV